MERLIRHFIGAFRLRQRTDLFVDGRLLLAPEIKGHSERSLNLEHWRHRTLVEMTATQRDVRIEILARRIYCEFRSLDHLLVATQHWGILRGGGIEFFK